MYLIFIYYIVSSSALFPQHNTNSRQSKSGAKSTIYQQARLSCITHVIWLIAYGSYDDYCTLAQLLTIMHACVHWLSCSHSCMHVLRPYYYLLCMQTSMGPLRSFNLVLSLWAAFWSWTVGPHTGLLYCNMIDRLTMTHMRKVDSPAHQTSTQIHKTRRKTGSTSAHFTHQIKI